MVLFYCLWVVKLEGNSGTLDVGCGHSPKGDVNVDLFIEATSHRSYDQSKCDDVRLDVKKIPNFVRADAQFLPFRDNSFEEVSSNHVIEHVDAPLRMLKEMLRVSNNSIVIRCPHRFSSHKKKTLHIHSFNLTWFFNVFSKFGLTHECQYVGWRYIPHIYFTIIRLPSEIEVKAYKRKFR